MASSSFGCPLETEETGGRGEGGGRKRERGREEGREGDTGWRKGRIYFFLYHKPLAPVGFMEAKMDLPPACYLAWRAHRICFFSLSFFLSFSLQPTHSHSPLLLVTLSQTCLFLTKSSFYFLSTYIAHSSFLFSFVHSRIHSLTCFCIYENYLPYFFFFYL